MFCKVTKEEAIELNTLADQAFNGIAAGMATSIAMVHMSGKSPCMQTSALVHASTNHMMATLLGHRQAHGEFLDVKSLKELRKRPEVFLELIKDLNEILAAVMRGIDPKNDYMLNLFQMEKKSEPEKKA